MRVALVLIFACAAACAAAAEETALDAQKIVERADKHLRGETAEAEMTMTVVRPEWSREVGLKSWSKGQDYALILITAPDRDRGTVFLKRKNEVWNWVPSVEKVIKLPPSMMMQSWMGSDFTNDDLVRESSFVDDYVHEIEKDSTVDSLECTVIRSIPKPEAAVVWGKLRTWITKNDYLQLRAEFFDEDDKLMNILEFSRIREMGGRTIPTLMEMFPTGKEGEKTVIEYHSIQFDKSIPDGFFSEQNMKRVR